MEKEKYLYKWNKQTSDQKYNKISKNKQELEEESGEGWLEIETGWMCGRYFGWEKRFIDS